MIAHWCFEHGNEECDCLVNFMQMFIDAKDSHTDADLAMALELADLMWHDWLSDLTAVEVPESAITDADWLRTEVRNALLERAS